MEASWGRNWKDIAKIAKVQVGLEERRQDGSKRSEEEGRIRQRRRKLRSENSVRGSRRSKGSGGGRGL